MTAGSFAVEYRDTHTLRHSRPYKLLGDAMDREHVDRRKAALNEESTRLVRVMPDGSYLPLEQGND